AALSSAMTCGAVFTPGPNTTNVVRRGPTREPETPRDPGAGRPDRSNPPPKTTQGQTQSLPDPKANTSIPPPPPPGPEPGAQPTEPAKAAPTSKQHAEDEIQGLVKRYCSALESMNASTVQGLFNRRIERDYKNQFKDMKSLKCILADKPPEYITLDH